MREARTYVAKCEEDCSLGFEPLLDKLLDRPEDPHKCILTVGTAPTPQPTLVIEMTAEGRVRPPIDRKVRDGDRVLVGHEEQRLELGRRAGPGVEPAKIVDKLEGKLFAPASIRRKLASALRTRPNGP